MKISYTRHINERKHRVEFWLNNFDYIDGIDYLASLFCEEYGMHPGNKLEGIWFDIFPIHSNNNTYYLMWHEDAGIIVYSELQDKDSITRQETHLTHILDKLNNIIDKAESKGE